jgi:hypothetical protein
MGAPRNASISFHTNNEDKDGDTHITVTLVNEHIVIAMRISKDFGHFDDHSDSGPYALTMTNPSSKARLQSGKIVTCIDSNE